MRILLSVLALVALVVVAYAAEVSTWWDIDDARIASKIEIKISKSGVIEDVEYHVAPNLVPPAVTAAMAAMYPNDPPIAAEKEYEAGVLFYELAVMAVLDPGQQPVKVEAMFTPGGQLHSQEIETRLTSTRYPVPQPVQETVVEKYPNGAVNAWEVILDGDGATVEYHVKLTEGAKHYKLILLPNGYLESAYLEVEAEIEVPVPLR